MSAPGPEGAGVACGLDLGPTRPRAVPFRGLVLAIGGVLVDDSFALMHRGVLLKSALAVPRRMGPRLRGPCPRGACAFVGGGGIVLRGAHRRSLRPVAKPRAAHWRPAALRFGGRRV